MWFGRHSTWTRQEIQFGYDEDDDTHVSETQDDSNQSETDESSSEVESSDGDGEYTDDSEEDGEEVGETQVQFDPDTNMIIGPDAPSATTENGTDEQQFSSELRNRKDGSISTQAAEPGKSKKKKKKSKSKKKKPSDTETAGNDVAASSSTATTSGSSSSSRNSSGMLRDRNSNNPSVDPLSPLFLSAARPNSSSASSSSNPSSSSSGGLSGRVSEGFYDRKVIHPKPKSDAATKVLQEYN